MSNQLVKQSELIPGVVQLTLSDPATRNAMSEEMALQFEDSVKKLRDNKLVRAVVLRGEGVSFSGGGHLDMLFNKTKISPEENKKLMMLFYRQFLSIVDLAVPTIAAINGHAVGAGLCLSLACDIRIACSEAKLGLNFVRIGLHPGMGATYFLEKIIGPAKATELLYCGRIITALEGEKIGLVNSCWSLDKFDAAVIETAQAISSSGPQAIRALKESLRVSRLRSLAECLEREAECQSKDYASAEFLEGITAAKEKREAKF